MQTHTTRVSATFTDHKLDVQVSNPESVSRFAGYSVQKIVDVSNSLPSKPMAPHQIATGSVPWVAREHFVLDMTADQKIPLSNRYYTALKTAEPHHGRNIAVVTGESGLLASLPELSKLTRVIVQVEDNPAILLMTNAILNQLPDMESPQQYLHVIRSAFQRVKEQIPQLKDTPEEVVEQFVDYLDSLPGLHFCSSPARLQATRAALQQCVVIPVRASYFNGSEMTTLNEAWRECDLVFLNLSNTVACYPLFYRENPFDGRVQGILSTQYIKDLPVTASTLCTYSFFRAIGYQKPLMEACPGTPLCANLHRIMKGRALNIGDRVNTFSDPEPVFVLKVGISALDKTCNAEIETKLLAEVRNLLALLSRDELQVLQDHLQSLNKRFRRRSPVDPVRKQFMEILTVACTEASQVYHLQNVV